MDSPHAGRLRILVVDDNRDNAEALAELLGLWDYDARIALSGAAALQSALNAVPDCLISDISMPGMTGYELARRVRSDSRLAAVKLIALSAFKDDDHDREAREAGFDHYLTKSHDPARLQELLAMMEEIKEIASKTRELAKQNVDLVGETRDILKEVKEDVKEVKEEITDLKGEVQELKEEVKELKNDRDGQNGTPAPN